MTLRPQCRPCPWRKPESIPAAVVAHARQDPTGFVCHTRCGPCPGPTLANLDDVDGVS